MAVTLTKEFWTNLVLFVVACLALGLSIWAFATPCKKEGFGERAQKPIVCYTNNSNVTFDLHLNSGDPKPQICQQADGSSGPCKDSLVPNDTECFMSTGSVNYVPRVTASWAKTKYLGFNVDSYSGGRGTYEANVNSANNDDFWCNFRPTLGYFAPGKHASLDCCNRHDGGWTAAKAKGQNGFTDGCTASQ